MDDWKDRIVNILQYKRLKEPQEFREYLPEVDYLLSRHFKQPVEPPKARMFPDRPLTDCEADWLDVTEKLGDWTMASKAAVKGLQRCAALLSQDFRTYLVDRDSVQKLFHKVTGKSPESYDCETTIPVLDGGPVEHNLSAIRGMYLQLDGAKQLVSIAIDPVKVAEGRSMLEMIKPRPDIATDVNVRPDDYLAMQDPHGRW